MKALLLRVGIDKGCGGCLAPIYEDGTYKYIPIPEERATREDRIYRNLFGEDQSLLDLLPKRLHNRVVHFDPEFETFTYGDPTSNKSRQLRKLLSGDLLVFYAGLEPTNEEDLARLYIIGYFTVMHVHDFGSMSGSERIGLDTRLKNNAHLKRKYPDEGLAIVEGDPTGSRLYSKALPLGDGRNYVLKDLESILGYEGSALRAVGHWVTDDYVQGLRKYLDSGILSLIDTQTRLFSYVLRSDSGFAPNVTGGYCTLACCKPRIRSASEVGDWVMGTLPKEFGWNRLAYLMRVNETLTFDDYFHDKRFQMKKPSVDPIGDNIYYKQHGRFVQVENSDHGKEDVPIDTKADRALIGSLFWYFGKEAIEIPSEFHGLIRKGIGHQTNRESGAILDFVSWISARYRIGIHGKPRNTKPLNASKKRSCK